MTIEAGSKGKDSSLRTADDPDPVHHKAFHPLGPVNGLGGANLSGPYEPVLDWPHLPHPGEWKSGAGRGVIAETPDRIFAVCGGEIPPWPSNTVWGHATFLDLRFTDVYPKNQLEIGRHCHEICIYDREGNLLETWDQWRDELQANHRAQGQVPNLGYINRIRVDPNDLEKHIWIVGSGITGVFKFTNDGEKLVLKIDAKNVPEKYQPFMYAQDVEFMPNGDILIGHVHNIMRFSSEGEFLGMIGKAGKGPLEFDGIHGLEVHPTTHNIYVADRVNERIQVLDPEGKLIEIWPGFQGVYTIRLTADGKYLWTSNGFSHKFMKYDLHGKLIPQATWGTFGIAPGTVWGPHYFETDIEGNLYVAEDYAGRVQKFRVMDGVDPDDPQLIGQLSR